MIPEWIPLRRRIVFPPVRPQPSWREDLPSTSKKPAASFLSIPLNSIKSLSNMANLRFAFDRGYPRLSPATRRSIRLPHQIGVAARSAGARGTIDRRSAMQRCIRNFAFLPGRRSLLRAWTLVCLTTALAEGPSIDRIELTSADRVVFHFQVEANQTCELQAADVLSTNGQLSVAWTTLLVFPANPQSRQYVVADRPTRPQRFYRLRIVPE